MRFAFPTYLRSVAFAVATAWALPAFAATFNVSGPPRDIIDVAGGIDVSLNSPVGGIIERDTELDGISIGVTTSSVFSDHLEISLTHNGITVLLYQGQGDTADARVDATFSQATALVAPATGAVVGTVLPVESLDVFRGQDLAGIWTLRIVDPTGNFGETDLDAWRFGGNLEPLDPSRSVALFFNPIYIDVVDETPGNGFADAEGINLRELLTFLGHNVETFTGIDAGALATVLAGKDVLIIPSLEGPNLDGKALHPDLSPAAQNEIRNFVAGGGTLITNSSLFGDNGDLIAALFGWPAFEAAGTATGLIQENTLQTPFQGGPGGAVAVSFNRGLQGLPAEREVFYQGAIASGDSDIVVSVPYPLDGSGGQVLWLANNFFNSLPEGFSDGGWPAILDRAIKDVRAPFVPQQTVAFFNDTNFVNAGDAANLEASLLTLGHDVRPFTGTTLAEMNAALANADVLVIPDPEIADPQPAFNASGAETAIFDFVQAGGVLILHAATSENLLEAVVARDPLFDPLLSGDNAVDVMPGTEGPATSVSAAGTPFSFPVVSLPVNTNTDAFTNIPSRGATPLYTSGLNAVAALFRVGAGSVYWLGWDWEDGSEDGGWVDSLGRAVSAAGPLPIPEPGAALSTWAALGALASLARRKRKRAYSASKKPRRARLTRSG